MAYCQKCGADIGVLSVCPNFRTVSSQCVPSIIPVSFFSAYTSFWTQIFDYKSRARRCEYWIPFVVNIGIHIIVPLVLRLLLALVTTWGDSVVINALAIAGSMFSYIFDIAVCIANISLSVRRLHDIGNSGWWYLLSLIPCGIGSIILLVWCGFIDGQHQPNQWGDSPKYRIITRR